MTCKRRNRRYQVIVARYGSPAVAWVEYGRLWLNLSCVAALRKTKQSVFPLSSMVPLPILRVSNTPIHVLLDGRSSTGTSSELVPLLPLLITMLTADRNSGTFLMDSRGRIWVVIAFPRPFRWTKWRTSC